MKKFEVFWTQEVRHKMTIEADSRELAKQKFFSSMEHNFDANTAEETVIIGDSVTIGEAK